MVRNAVPFNECDEIRGRIARQRGLGKMGIRGEEIFGLAVQVSEIAAATARDENLFPQTVTVFQTRDAPSALACLNGAHQARRAATENQCIEMMGHVDVSSAP